MNLDPAPHLNRIYSDVTYISGRGGYGEKTRTGIGYGEKTRTGIGYGEKTRTGIGYGERKY